VLALVVDSATPAITAAVVRVDDSGVDLLAERITVDARAHGERLGPSIEAVLAEAGAKPADLAAIVAGTGPGPFTGLRVGLVTAEAFRHALEIPAYGVCSLDALGYGRLGRVLVATDARRKEVYWACYAGGPRVEGPAVDRPEVVAIGARRLGVERAVGDGALRYADVLALPVAEEPRYPSAAALAQLAAARIRAGAESEPLTPLYLRRPDAVEPTARKSVL
jgi:tRNA threonylcarbamoyl adenosine modification protein YeaZ